MLKIAVCDDDNGELSHVKALLEQYQAQRHAAAHIDLFHSAMELMDALRPIPFETTDLSTSVIIQATPLS